MFVQVSPAFLLLASFSIGTFGADPPPFPEPVLVPSKDGKIDRQLNVVFGSTNVGGATPAKVDIRAYSLTPPDPNNPSITHPLLPGPTFVFHPGDLLRLRFHNYLNRANNPRLNSISSTVAGGAPPGKGEDIPEQVPHEINIPNNANITNLHVHGLHVDPKQDNVALMILPEDADPSSLVPELQRFVPTINRWWTRAYQYKIPADHLPGTYWYHAHKHGATSAQVENGMAGTLVMLPNKDEDSIIPGLWDHDPSKTHDRVLVLQQIAGFAAPPPLSVLKGARRNGAGTGPGAAADAAAAKPSTGPFNTINGQVQPTLQLPVGQLERWRFVIAGADHTTSADVWVGKIVPPVVPPNMVNFLSNLTDVTKAAEYLPDPKTKIPPKMIPLQPADRAAFQYQSIPGRVKLVAVDGITMWESRDVRPSTPAMGSAGNRFDLLIQPDEPAQSTGPYYVYQNYPISQSDVAQVYASLFTTTPPDLGNARYKVLTTGWMNGSKPGAIIPPYVQQDVTDPAKSVPVPSVFNTDPFALGTNYQGLKVTWATVNPDGSPNGSTPNMSIGPLIKAERNATTNGINPVIRSQVHSKPAVGWQPMPDALGQKPVTAAVLMNLNISGTAVGPKLPSDADLNKILSSQSPAGTGSKLMKVNQHGQLVPGIPDYVSPFPPQADGRQAVVFDRGQFTFNYVDKATPQTLAFRQFWLNGRQFSVDDYQGNPNATALIQQPVANVAPSLGTFVPNDGSAPQGWTNQVNGNIHITNPGYYVPLTQDPTTKIYNFDYANFLPLNNEAVTGLAESTPPVSTTQEEWLLINNSDLFHPFHIHISPFFVTEIGQLNYDATQPPGQHWSFKKLTLADKADPTKPFSYVVGNWWDVITLPPHGYVKMKTWINVPSQFPADKSDADCDLIVKDNANVYGSWVLHCHILRHEDRGMMTMVNTVPKLHSLSGTWTDDQMASHQIEDARGGLTITDLPAANPPVKYPGTFDGGVGNPLMTQPWLGSMSPAAGPYSFCVTMDTKMMVLSNGHVWGRSQPEPNAAGPLNLTGNWVDPDGNVAAITDDGTLKLTFAPVPVPGKPPVWWSAGTGQWIRGGAPPQVFVGGQVLRNLKGQNQTLTFCVTLNTNTMVFGNGITWKRLPK
jgi:FtsP/CotA-like multicopper oxidase with cupredoxin domain